MDSKYTWMRFFYLYIEDVIFLPNGYTSVTLNIYFTNKCLVKLSIYVYSIIIVDSLLI
jgi:hypothetical protein